ncbi:hypothetical protein KJ953_04755 [Patescibacteria group bacterium]|nr:hypothetical protein [Patescibacteria group bacterium]
MKKWLVLFLISLTVTLSIPAIALECDGTPPSDPSQLIDYIKNCNEKINESKGQQYTLNSAIIVLNSKINLAQGQINQTQAQIDGLEQEISLLSTILVDLNKSLDELSVTYVARVRESYKQRDLNPLRLFFSSDSFGQLIIKLKYFNSVKTRDRLILQELEKARLDFDQQKLTKENKQQEVEDLKTKLVGQRVALGGQKAQKQDLLVITKNDEQKFQALLASARAELEAIEAIIAGKGVEEEVGEINQGDVIANVITGSSCNSSGTHLHFMIGDNSLVKNPFDYLKSVDYYNNSGGDPFNPSGSWDWPLSSPIYFNQGYGSTWAIQNTWVSSIYSFHNGIDISGGSTSVMAVKSGKLYRGGYTGSAGCSLKYVRVDHADSDIDTYYLHVNYF